MGRAARQAGAWQRALYRRSGRPPTSRRRQILLAKLAWSGHISCHPACCPESLATAAQPRRGRGRVSESTENDCERVATEWAMESRGTTTWYRTSAVGRAIAVYTDAAAGN